MEAEQRSGGQTAHVISGPHRGTTRGTFCFDCSCGYMSPLYPDEGDCRRGMQKHRERALAEGEAILSAPLEE